MDLEQLRVPASGHFHLAGVDPDETFGLDKQEVKDEYPDLVERLSQLQSVMYAEQKHSLLIVLQAMDGGGKDGTIRALLTGVNPQGVQVTSFKVPSAEELAHDYLWRIHKAVPPRGIIGLFNRSQYEDVLVVRVLGLVPKDVWRARYDQINRFERHLAENGTTILKFFLHISRDEQKQRFEERLEDPQKRWKFAKGDLGVREQWDDYMAAYEDALDKCSTDWAPWYVIPANRNWLRNWLVARIVVKTLEGLDMQYPEPEEGLDQIVIPD
jgi:PPK2 family polyphosphate:nucleotide phosphotransferase